MNYQEFIENVKEHISKTLQLTVDLCPILKNNGTLYDGLVIHDPVLNVSPMIYLNAFYSMYLEGESLDTIYNAIIDTYHEHLPEDDFDISLFCDYQNAQNRIVMKLINAKRNEDLLKQVPHIKIYDLAIIFLCTVSEFSNDYATIMVHNSHLKLWNVTVDEIYQQAQTNSLRILPPRLDNLHDVFEHITCESLAFLEELEILILTNYLRIHGATCMVYPNLLDEIAQIYNDDLIILPSSIHEVLIFPKGNVTSKYTLSYFNEIVQEVNETQLMDVEILSDHAYLYHLDSKEITY